MDSFETARNIKGGRLPFRESLSPLQSYRKRSGRWKMRLFGKKVVVLAHLIRRHNKQLNQAKAAPEKAVDLLTSENEYKGWETGATIVYAECYLYLALIASEEGDAFKAEFYGARSVSFAAGMAKHTKNSAALGIEITVCALVCEFCLAVKNKPKAVEYAETGPEACSVLAGIDPQNDRLQLQTLLEKYRKKALRKFF